MALFREYLALAALGLAVWFVLMTAIVGPSAPLFVGPDGFAALFGCCVVMPTGVMWARRVLR